MIKLLTFDLDDTLWDVATVVTRADQAMRDHLAAHFPRFTEKFDTLAFYNLRRTLNAQYPERKHDLNAMRELALVTALRECGYLADAESGAAAAMQVFSTWRNTVDFFPGVMETLTALQKQFPLYALSNGGADIAQLGLDNIFSLYLNAARVGAAKPNPRIYRQALEHAGLEAHEAVHIGDHPVEDIRAAQSVGMKTIWINRHGKPWELDGAPHAEVADFRQLPAIVATLANPET